MPPAAPGPWITRWQAVLVAAVTAIGGITVAAITVSNGKDAPSQSPATVVTSAPAPSSTSNPEPTKSPGTAASPLAPPKPPASLQSVAYRSEPDGGRRVIVSRLLESIIILSPPSNVYDYRAFAQPVNPVGSEGNGGPIVIYLSDRLQIAPGGSWQATIMIASTEKRDLDVYMGVLQPGARPDNLVAGGHQLLGDDTKPNTLYQVLSERTRVSQPN
jgi:hypothetical protein